MIDFAGRGDALEVSIAEGHVFSLSVQREHGPDMPGGGA